MPLFQDESKCETFLMMTKRPQYEALENNYRVCGVYSPEPRAEVYCVRLNFNISKLGNSHYQLS